MPFMIFDQDKSATGLLYFFSGVPATSAALQDEAADQKNIGTIT